MPIPVEGQRFIDRDIGCDLDIFEQGDGIGRVGLCVDRVLERVIVCYRAVMVERSDRILRWLGFTVRPNGVG